jgi:hypothetical protein
MTSEFIRELPMLIAVPFLLCLSGAVPPPSDVDEITFKITPRGEGSNTVSSEPDGAGGQNATGVVKQEFWVNLDLTNAGIDPNPLWEDELGVYVALVIREDRLGNVCSVLSGDPGNPGPPECGTQRMSFIEWIPAKAGSAAGFLDKFSVEAEQKGCDKDAYSYVSFIPSSSPDYGSLRERLDRDYRQHDQSPSGRKNTMTTPLGEQGIGFFYGGVWDGDGDNEEDYGVPGGPGRQVGEPDIWEIINSDPVIPEGDKSQSIYLSWDLCTKESSDSGE